MSFNPRPKHNPLVACLLLLAAACALLAQTPSTRRVVFIPYEDAGPILEAEAEILPQGLSGKSQNELARDWPNWIARHDAEVRTRLAQGDEDSVVNFLAFGTSYTRQPRISAAQLGQLNQGGASNLASQNSPVVNALKSRVNDLMKAMLAPGTNERLLFARQLLVGRKGFNLATPAGRAQAERFLLESVTRVLSEHAAYARVIEQARLLGDPSEEFAERSRLYRTRGLSSDTSILPNFALEEALKNLKARSLFAPKSIRRVAIVGPGLDFTDKQEGYDFYPQQTIQPFAIVDTLLRLGLAQSDALQVTTFDLSPRVNGHLSRARERALRGQFYTVQLPRDMNAGWKPDIVSYWEHFGDQIGTPAQPVTVPADAGDLRVRAVRIRPDVVARVTPVDLNIVAQRMEAPEAERFDLIIATNIFVYYDTFEQSLAMNNVEHMLKPGGLLLSNNALLELPFSRVHSVGYTTAVYSDREGDGDHIVWYRRAVN
ncbi:MAG TPA: hypothetical protein VK619_02550 [Pyrinomonadaceae bacterium]|nr:hypothetical protein [Pyrinomonadaceae bacterium]